VRKDGHRQAGEGVRRGSEGMGNEERTNIALGILLESLRGGLPNELFKLNEKENSKKRKRQRGKEREKGRREIPTSGEQSEEARRESGFNKERKSCS